MRMQCSRSPRALDDNRHSLRLGGQHGEEAKDEDEISGEEGRAQDAPEEEVKYSPLSVFDFEGVVDCVTRAGASRRAVSASRRASTPPVPVDDRGRRRDGGPSPKPILAMPTGRSEEQRFRTSTVGASSASGIVPRPPTPSVFSTLDETVCSAPSGRGG